MKKIITLISILLLISLSACSDSSSNSIGPNTNSTVDGGEEENTNGEEWIHREGRGGCTEILVIDEEEFEYDRKMNFPEFSAGKCPAKYTITCSGAARHGNIYWSDWKLEESEAYRCIDIYGEL